MKLTCLIRIILISEVLVDVVGTRVIYKNKSKEVMSLCLLEARGRAYSKKKLGSFKRGWSTD